MNDNEKEGVHHSKRSPEKERIVTQIHRRRNIKAFSPLESEWESSLGGHSPADDELSETDETPNA